ncbi:hypothetical protein D031_4219B, partial [Vibrio parahaemolyticus VP-48]
SFDHG